MALHRAVRRLTGIADADLAGAPSPIDAIAALAAFLGDGATLVGHNVAFDTAFLARAGLPPHATLDTADLASILLPGAPSYALQRLAADEAIVPEAAHRALHDALTCAGVLAALHRRARALPALVLEECRAQSAPLGPAYVDFFEQALRSTWAAPEGGDEVEGSRPSGEGAWVPERDARSTSAGTPESDRAQRGATRGNVVAAVGAAATIPSAAAGTAAETFVRLAATWPGFEQRPEQLELAGAVEATFEGGGVLLAEAGTGTGKSLAYLVPALARAAIGERVIVSTHTLPLQEQLVMKDLPAAQGALGTEVPVAILKGRSNYLCARRWQSFRTAPETAEEARLALKILVWRTSTETGDRAELNLMGAESALWPRLSADDETCDGRRCASARGGCFLQNARDRAGRAAIVVVNHALLLSDARSRGGILPEAEHVVVDEAHRLEDVASDVFGHRLDDGRLRRDLDRVARAPLVTAASRDARSAVAATIRDAVERSRAATLETFGALAVLLGAAPTGDDRLRVTPAVRASDDRWLPVELAGERLSDALADVVDGCEQLRRAAGADAEDAADDLAAAAVEVQGARFAIARGIHDPRPGDIVWLAALGDGGVALHVVPEHVGAAVRRSVVDRHHSVVMTSATLAVAGSLAFTAERLGVGDSAATLVLGSSFDHAGRSALVVPADVAYPGEDGFASDVAATIADVARAIGGRTLALFTSHASLREVARLLEGLEDDGIAVLAQGAGASRRAIVDRFRQGGAVLLGTQSFWEGVDLPGDLLRCVVIAKLPFAVPDDPVVAGRADRYDDPFREFQVPQAALRLRQGFGRLLRTRSDRGAVVLMDRRVVERDYGPTFLASLPDVRVRRVPREDVAAVVADAAGV